MILLSTNRNVRETLLNEWNARIPGPIPEVLEMYEEDKRNKEDVSDFEFENIIWLTAHGRIPIEHYAACFTIPLEKVYALANFISKPGRQSAKRLLRLYGIGIPFQSALRSFKNISGGKGGKIINETKRKELVKSFMYIDALHDMRAAVSPVETASKLLNQVSDNIVPSSVKDEICVPGQVWTSTHVLTPYLLKAINLRIYEEIDTITITNIEMRDTYLWKLWMNWRKQKNLEIVMDGIYDISAFEENDKVFLQCAFLLMFFSNATRIENTLGKIIHTPDAKSNIETISLLDGTFMTIESMMLPSFVSRYINVIKMISKIKGDVVVNLITDIQPTLFEHESSYESIKVFPDGIELNGVRLPYKLPMSKRRYQYIIKNTIHDETALEQIVIFNFLKDAYKVDVAIQRNAAYIANDRLAFLWYCTLCNLTHKKRNGYYYTLREYDVINFVA